MEKVKKYISSLVLNNFRNYSNGSFDFSSDFNIISGNNGVGKTTILEALSLFSNSKGLRGAAINDLVSLNRRSPFLPPDILFSLFIKLSGCDCEKMSMVLKNDLDSPKKTIKIDDENIKNNSAMGKFLKITWLTPQMDNFFVEDTSNRRKFLDKTAELLYLNHYDTVKKYEFFLRERMKILTTQTFDDKWLNIVERKLCELGVAIASVRNEVVAFLNRIALDYTSYFPTGEISIEGDIENMLLESKALEVEKYFAEKLRNNRLDDVRAKRTLFGVHRSDLRVFNKNKNIIAPLCSTGEQKMLLLSLMIVRCIFCNQIADSANILLLDEICSHLDNVARKALFSELEKLDIQIFLTGVDKNDFASLDGNFIDLKEV